MQIYAISTGVLRFFLFIVDRRFAPMLGRPDTPDMSWHQGLRNSCSLSQPLSLVLWATPSFPILLSQYWLPFLLRVLSLTPPHAVPVPFQLLLPVPIYHPLCFCLCRPVSPGPCALTHPPSLFSFTLQQLLAEVLLAWRLRKVEQGAPSLLCILPT